MYFLNFQLPHTITATTIVSLLQYSHTVNMVTYTPKMLCTNWKQFGIILLPRNARPWLVNQSYFSYKLAEAIA